MAYFSTFTIFVKTVAVNPQVSYLSPPLAFNIGLHIAWLDMLIRKESSHAKISFPDYSDQFLCNRSILEVFPLPISSGEGVSKSLIHQIV